MQTRRKRWRENQKQIIESILEEVKLPDYQKKLLSKKWINHLDYTHTRAGRNCWDYYFTQIIILISGITIPVLINIEGDKFEPSINWIITGLGLATSIAAGFNQLFKFERKWIHYRVISEKLRIEGYAFLGLSSSYDKFDSHEKAFKTFSTRIDEIMTLDLNQYKELLLTNQKDKKDKRNKNAR